LHANSEIDTASLGSLHETLEQTCLARRLYGRRKALWGEAMKRTRRRIVPRADINVTPFIDILLVLLVIFMTISPSVPTGLNATVPQQPPPDRRAPDEKVMVLSIDRNGIIKINQEEVELSVLIGRLQDVFKTRSDRTIFIQADDQLLFNNVAQVIDAAKGAGAERLGLMTESISAK
jgi:biopolymer transport protein TolR